MGDMDSLQPKEDSLRSIRVRIAALEQALQDRQYRDLLDRVERLEAASKQRPSGKEPYEPVG